MKGIRGLSISSDCNRHFLSSYQASSLKKVVPRRFPPFLIEIVARAPPCEVLQFRRLEIFSFFFLLYFYFLFVSRQLDGIYGGVFFSFNRNPSCSREPGSVTFSGNVGL